MPNSTVVTSRNRRPPSPMSGVDALEDLVETRPHELGPGEIASKTWAARPRRPRSPPPRGRARRAHRIGDVRIGLTADAASAPAPPAATRERPRRGTSTDCGSRRCAPITASSPRRTSPRGRASTPFTSIIWVVDRHVEGSDGLPWATRPREGLIDAMPQQYAGLRSEPADVVAQAERAHPRGDAPRPPRPRTRRP